MPKSPQGVAAVDRALSILAAYSPDDSALTLSELANRTGLYKSTILRLIASLERRGCILRIESGAYQLGPTLVRWGSLYIASVKIETHVMPALQRLSRDTGECASFFVRHGSVRICLAHVDCPHPLRDHVNVGDVLPLERGSGGKVLTAFDQTAGDRSRAPKSMVIGSAREIDPHASGLSAPVFGPGGELRGALSLSGPGTRFTEAAMPRFTRALLGAAIEITRRLGGDPAALEEAAGVRRRSSAVA